MAAKIIIWDWNGCPLDDCEHVYRQGPMRIFAHYGLLVPSLETYRNEVTADFMGSFYWKYGVPAEATAEGLFAIMKKGYDEFGEPPMQRDALAALEICRTRGYWQFLVTGFDGAMLQRSLAHHGVGGYFEETHAGVLKKTDIVRDILRRADSRSDAAIGVTDTLGDVEAARSRRRPRLHLPARLPRPHPHRRRPCRPPVHGRRRRFSDPAHAPLIGAFFLVGSFIMSFRRRPGPRTTTSFAGPRPTTG